MKIFSWKYLCTTINFNSCQYFINTCFSGHNIWTLSHKALTFWSCDEPIKWTFELDELSVACLTIVFYDEIGKRHRISVIPRWNGDEPWWTRAANSKFQKKYGKAYFSDRHFLLCCYIDIFIYCIFYNKMCW